MSKLTKSPILFDRQSKGVQSPQHRRFPTKRSGRLAESRVPCAAPVVSLPAVQGADRGPGVRKPVPFPACDRRETIRTSQVPGEPCCPYAVFSDPGRTEGIWHGDASARPPLCPQRRLLRESIFRGSIARPWDWL